MSILFGRVNLRISYILEPIDERVAKVIGFRFDANGRVLESPTLMSATVRSFIHNAATTVSGDRYVPRLTLY